MRGSVLGIVLLCLIQACALKKAVVNATPTAKPEPTFYKVCWIGKQATFNEEACDHPEQIVWTRKHIRYAFAEKTADFREDFRAAAQEWNDLIGYQLFVETKMGWDLLIYDGNPSMIHLAATAMFKEAEELLSSIEVYRGDHMKPGTLFAQRVFVHELGHVLGLEHDPDNDRSIMYPTFSSVDATSLTRQISEADSAAIRNIYKSK